MDKKKEILELFKNISGEIQIRNEHSRGPFAGFRKLELEDIDQALTELWNTAIDEAEKAVGEDGELVVQINDSTIESWVGRSRDIENQLRQEIRNNLRKLKV